MIQTTKNLNVMKKRVSILILLLSFVYTITYGQSTYQASGESDMVVKGTSTLHDWEVNAEKINASGEIKLNSNTIESISSFKLIIPVESIKSESKGMDDKMYDALKSEDHPNITFKLNKIQAISSTQIKALGYLTIAGTTKQVVLIANYKVENGKIIIKGSKDLKMTDYNVDPPTAVFGTIRSGDEVTIAYNLVLK